MKIVKLSMVDVSQLKKACDEYIGLNYYSIKDLEIFKQNSQFKNSNCSFALVKSTEVLGFRIAFAPQTWLSNISGDKISPSLWRAPKNTVAYFKSLFIHPSYQKQGWSKKLNEKTLTSLKALNTKAIVTHCWKESTNNSSFQYLTKSRFVKVKEHNNFWAHINYNCTRCKKPPCKCTAIEMIKYL